MGALRQAIELQNSGKYICLYSVVDLHSLTEKFIPRGKSREIFDMAVDLLALGINPKKSIFFLQSHILEHAALAWIFNNLTPVGRLTGMIEYKEKIAQGQSANVGLLDYPVLMAADILLYRAKFVPVGEDQRQHLELARDIARNFNSRFDKTFPEPVAILGETPRIMSLTNPSKKMSKSMPGGCLYLTDSPKVIREKIKTAVTDSFSEIGYDPVHRPAVSNLIRIYSEFSGESVKKTVEKFKGVKYSEFKKELAELIIKKLRPFQKKRERLAKNKGEVSAILEKGRKRAEKIASENFKEIKGKVGLI